MNSNVPAIKQTAWISLIPHLIIMGLLTLLWLQFEVDSPIVYGALTYLIISFSLRTFIPRDHNSGISLVKNEKYAEAIDCFRKSYDFFNRYEWIDKYRYLTLLSSSKMTYREMALNNIAFCYGQSGDGIKSKEFYELTLHQFPNNGPAKAGLQLIKSIESQSK